MDMFCAGVSFICAYVLDTETNQSLTTIHSHFHTPTSLRPCHFDSHSHFSSPFLVLKTQKLEPSRTKKITPVQHMGDQYNREDDDFDLILLNHGWEIRPAIVISESGCPQVVTCRNHGGGSKYHVLYPPHYPDHHLSAKYTNQLSPIVVQPRIAWTTCAKEYCTTLGTSHQYSHFPGTDSCDVGLNGNSRVTSELLCGHESPALAGCPNLHALLSLKVAEHQILPEFASLMKEEAIRRHPTGSLTKSVQGFTFVPFGDAIFIQLGIGEDGKNTIPCVKLNRSKVVQCRRTWARTIVIVQTEDIHWYGTQF